MHKASNMRHTLFPTVLVLTTVLSAIVAFISWSPGNRDPACKLCEYLSERSASDTASPLEINLELSFKICPEGPYYNRTAYDVALQHADCEALAVMIHEDVDVNAPTTERTLPALMTVVIAWRAGQHLKARCCADLLLQKGADVNVANEDGMTALHFAAHDTHVNAIEWLIDHGADINKTDRQGMTPLHHASLSIQQSPRIINKLLSLGADPNKKNNEGKAPLDIANSDEKRHALRAALDHD